MLAVIRQLAEAEGSPIPTIKEKHHPALRCVVREAPGRTLGIQEFEVRCTASYRGELDGGHCASFDAGGKEKLRVSPRAGALAEVQLAPTENRVEIS